MFYSTQSLVEMLLNEADVVEDPFASKSPATDNNSSEQPPESSNKVEDPFASKSPEGNDASSPEPTTEGEEESAPSEDTEESPGNKVDDPFLGDHPDGAETSDDGKQSASNENNLSTINIGGKSEQDTPALREYFFNNFNDFYTQYDSLKNLISSVQKQVGGMSSLMSILEQLNDKINSNRKMIDNFFKEDLIVSGEIEVIFKIYKIHQTDIKLITTTLKDVCRSVFNKDTKKDNKKKS